jgi:DNA-binding response OmpR family regulator
MILLVDDDTRLLAATKRVMQKDSHILFARDGAHARSLVDGIDFSVALVDLSLPDCSGFQLIEELHRTNPDLPIIAISGVFSGAALESAKEFGAVEVLSKPPAPAWDAAIERVRNPST